MAGQTDLRGQQGAWAGLLSGGSPRAHALETEDDGGRMSKSPFFLLLAFPGSLWRHYPDKDAEAPGLSRIGAE